MTKCGGGEFLSAFGSFLAQENYLEPTLLVLDIGLYKVFIRLRKINDPFDCPDNRADATGEKGKHDLDYAFGGITENKLVNAEPADQDPAKTGGQLLFCSQLLPILHLA